MRLLHVQVYNYKAFIPVHETIRERIGASSVFRSFHSDLYCSAAPYEKLEEVLTHFQAKQDGSHRACTAHIT